jgi:hypothetical protein
MTTETTVEERLSQPLSNTDLERHTGITQDQIVKYSELADYNKIEDLLPTDNSFKIILIEDRFNAGHWVCVLRYKNKGKSTIEYFNSYGAKWDTDWKFINKMMRIILGQNTNEMTRLMNQAEKDGFEVVWNRKKFQKLGSNIQTCGRHCVMRIEALKMGYDSIDDYEKLIKKFKTETGGNADYVVAKYIA